MWDIKELTRLHGDIKMAEHDFTDAKPAAEPVMEIAKRIVELHPEEFMGGILYGWRRVGKSIYAIKTMMEVFMAYGCDAETAWRYALLSLYFDPHRFVEDINWLAERQAVWPVITLDDAGCGMAGSMYFTDRKLYSALDNVMDTIGTTITGLLLTTPRFTKIISMVRDAEEIYRIKVFKKPEDGKYGRVARGNAIIVLPSGKILICSRADDRNFDHSFNVRLPDEKYRMYKAIRAIYTIQTTKAAMDLVKSKKMTGIVPTAEDFAELREDLDEAEKIILGEAGKRDRISERVPPPLPASPLA